MPEDDTNGEPTTDEQALDFGKALEPVDQASVPFMGEEATAARLDGLGIYVTVKSIWPVSAILTEKYCVPYN